MKYAVGMICAIAGALIGHYLFEGATAEYASLLISYHFFLAILVFTARQEKGLSMPLGMTVLTHTAVLGLLVGLAYEHEHIPFFGIVRWCIPALAPFEINWLFSGKGKIVAAAEAPQAMPEATAEDHEAFREYLAQEDRAFRKPGISISDEFNLWLVDRSQKQAAARTAAGATPAAAAETPEPAATENWGWMKPASVANAGMDGESTPGGTVDGSM